MKLKWNPAPVKTQWGDEMVVASVAIDKDHTVDLYCERDQAPKVDAMFAQRSAEQPAQDLREGATVGEHKEEKPMHPEIRKMWGEYFDKCFAVFAEDHKKFLAQPAQQQCKHKWKNSSSKRQTVYQCEVCGIYTFEQPAQCGKQAG